MAIVPGKTNIGLVKHAEKALQEKWWYMWGTFGNYLTQTLLDQKANQYPGYNRNNGMYAVHKKHLGQTVCDCVGLIKGYCMWDEETDLPKYKGSLDVNTGGMYSKATEKGTISTIPEIPGICVYTQGHVGVYIGDGWVIECAGNCGAIKTPLKGSKGTRWTHWFKCPFITYTDGEVSGSAPTAPSSSLNIGDSVRVKPQAKTYTGVKLASWVYSSTYKVMEVAGNRIVIGDGRAVTAAVRSEDLIQL